MRQLLLTAAAVSLTAAAVIGSAGAATAPAASDLASRSGVERFLQTLGVDPAGVVVQRGVRNYAGPNCPGKGWTCTNATRVLQLGQSNVFICEPGEGSDEGGFQTCTIVQPGPGNNTAKCVQRTTEVPSVQHCSISQTGGRNIAEVIQEAAQSTASDQDAIQTAVVTQTGPVRNKLTITQDVTQTTSEGTVQSQDAHQVANIDQNAGASAENNTLLRQTQFQRANNGTTQRQNAGPFPASIGDCSDEQFGPDRPNACANVFQSSVAGPNTLFARQRIDERSATAAVALQQQGTREGGIEGDVHQQTTSGAQMEDAIQTKAQALLAGPGSTQTQFDPIACCGIGSQSGGSQNAEVITQSAELSATEGTAADQSIAIFGTSNTPGSCSVTHHAQTNDDSIDASESREVCGVLIFFTTCSDDPPEGQFMRLIGEPEGCKSRRVPPPEECEECALFTAHALRRTG